LIARCIIAEAHAMLPSQSLSVSVPMLFCQNQAIWLLGIFCFKESERQTYRENVERIAFGDEGESF
jgi:hypothetical protein